VAAELSRSWHID